MGTGPAQSERVTRTEVARAAGTSVAVVSYVVNNGPRPVSADARRRVLEAIERTGYRPNGIAKALAAGQTGTYGLVVPDVSNPFFAALAYALEEQTYAKGRVLLLGNSAQSREREIEIINKFLQQRVDGLLYVGAEHQSSLDILRDSGTPVVALDRVPDGSRAASVTIDNVEAARVATDHLIGHGYRRIALLTGPDDLSTSKDRERGWREALEAAGIEAHDRWIFSGAFSRRGGLETGRRLFTEVDDIDAVFVASDQMAIGVVKAAGEFGKSVPDDLAIVTFDGTDDTEYFSPTLTTIAQPVDEIAREAIRLLSEPKRFEPQRITCRFELVLGRSCGCDG
jgi:LacI family transcriptional regulator